MTNFWLNEGHSFGITAAGGAGWQLAEWIVEGEPTIDMMGVDPRRFGRYASQGYLVQKNEEAYAKVFATHYPDEERAAARPLRQTPCYDRMKALGAVFGSIYGWERPNFFAPPGYELTEADLAKDEVILNENHPPKADSDTIKERWSFRRSNYFDLVGAECRNVHENVGLQDMSAFAKFEVSGRGAAACARPDPDQSDSQGDEPRHADLPAHGERWRPFGIHLDPDRVRPVLSRLGRCARNSRLRRPVEASARRWQRADRQGHDPVWRAGAGRAERARGPGQGRRYRRVQCGLSLADGPLPFRSARPALWRCE